MTIEIRHAIERGALSLDWLDAKFTFSFGDYYNPRHMGFGALRALNENRVAPGRGFDAARRSDLEILSYVCEGTLRHCDSLGHDVIVAAGGLQRMSAGSGVEHTERNASKTDPLRFVQIWILPETSGGAPSYETTSFARTQRGGGLRLIGSQDRRDGSVTICRDVDFYAASMGRGDAIAHPLGRDREAWIQVLRGAMRVDGVRLVEGDGAGLQDIEVLRLNADADLDFLLFDMPRG